eukprot:TRINITY_DN8543_c3_g1_i1.p1 TRINITY_DN8543_c3_g1~~TRINITY_DN8543_c3_g1_i1.p1  ORF type:complete len:1161 (+),score=396.67 TRINITY_DN8543_c3_g1_i1:68-3484(+)
MGGCLGKARSESEAIGGRIVHGAAGAGRAVVSNVGGLLHGRDTTAGELAATAAAVVVSAVPTVERGLLIALDVLTAALAALPSRPRPKPADRPAAAVLDPPTLSHHGGGGGLSARLCGARGGKHAAHQSDLRRTMCDFRHFAAASAAEGTPLWSDDPSPPGLEVAQWLWALPSRWVDCFPGANPDQQFHSAGVIRLAHDLERVIRERLRPPVSRGSEATWVQRLRRMPPAAASDGVTASFAHTYHFTVDGHAAPLQLHSALECSMRAVGTVEIWQSLTDTEQKAHRLCLSVLQPLLRALSIFLQWAPVRADPRPAFRAAPGEVTRGAVGGWTVWTPFTSLTADAAAAREQLLRGAGAGAGTLVCLMELSAADVSFASADPELAEEMLCPNTVVRVAGRLPPALLSLLSTDLSVAVFAEVREGAAELSSSAVVDLALGALRYAHFVFRDFQDCFVEPRVSSVATVAASEPLYSRLHRFLQSPSEDVLVVMGSAASGKTSASLAIAANLLQRYSVDDDHLPLFVWLPEVRNVMTDGGAVLQHIRDQLGLTDQDMWELRVRPLVVILDAVDETAGDPSALRGGGQSSLLARCGLSCGDWPASKFILSCRQEWADEHALASGHWGADPDRCSVVALQRFDDDMESTYVRRVAAKETRHLSQRLLGGPRDGPVAPALRLMRCARVNPELARRLQRSVFVEAQLDEEGTAAAEAAVAGADGTACVDCIVQETESVLAALRRSSPSASSMLGLPFVLSCAVAAGQSLSRRSPDIIAAAPLKEVFEAYVLDHIQRRIDAQPPDSPLAAVGDGHVQRQVVLAACERLAAALFSDGVGRGPAEDYYKKLDLPPAGGAALRRAVLNCMPLRSAGVVEDGDVIMMRHRTVTEYMLARLIESSPAGVITVGGSSLSAAPLVARFFAESVAALRISAPERGREVLAALTIAARKGDAHTANARFLLDACGWVPQSPLGGAAAAGDSVGFDAMSISHGAFGVFDGAGPPDARPVVSDELDALIDGVVVTGAQQQQQHQQQPSRHGKGMAGDPLLAPSPTRLDRGATSPAAPAPPIREEPTGDLFLPLAPAAADSSSWARGPTARAPPPPFSPPPSYGRHLRPLPPRFPSEAPPPCGGSQSPWRHMPPRWTAVI